MTAADAKYHRTQRTNDASAGLLDLLGDGRELASEDRWGLVVISKSGGTMETAVAFRQFLAKLRQSCGGDAELLKQLVVPVTGASGKLSAIAGASSLGKAVPLGKKSNKNRCQ